LVSNGIPVLKREFDTSFSMHNKFWVFDYRNNPNVNTMFLWTGSTNVTHAQFNDDRNNIIVIQDKSLCAAYTREFEEMWGSHGNNYDQTKARFGPQKVNNVPHIFNVAGTRMEVYFSPSDSVAVFLKNIILTKPTYSLNFCMLKYTLPEIEAAQHLIFNDGKLIKGVFDSSNIIAHGNAYFRMKGHPVPNTWNPAADVYYDPIHGLIHHKYMVIDADIPGGNKILSTGSFNWEIPAEEGNDENSLTIFDARINNLYYQEFVARFKESGGVITSAENEWDANASVNSVFQNYPNPFNNSTEIKFYVAESCDVQISVYDILGCKINTVEYQKMNPGFHEYLFDGSGLSSGVYFYNISVGDFSETRKMILQK
jgi:phosphatidylserine/phosphatidylglycerophosphate/cardiolipin synthase-like enzyme